MTRDDYIKIFTSFDFMRSNKFLTGSEYKVLSALSSYYPCFPSERKIADETGICEKTVMRAIKKMELDEMIVIKRGWKLINNRKTRVNQYEINYDLVNDLYASNKVRGQNVCKHTDKMSVNIRTKCPSKLQIENPNINIYKADALEGGLETNLANTAQIDNREISSESFNDIDSRKQVAFNAEIELSMLSDLDDDEELLAYAKLAEDGPVGPLEEQNREIIAKQSDSSTADQAPAKALETSPTLQPHKPPLTIPETSKNTEIDEMKVVRMWNIITAPYRITILKVCEMPNQKRWQNIRAFSKHLNIDINLWANIFQYIVKDGFWNGKGNSKGQKISKLSFDMILNADKLNNFIDERNHLRELMIQREIEDVEFSNINAPLDLQKEIGL